MEKEVKSLHAEKGTHSWATTPAGKASGESLWRAATVILPGEPHQHRHQEASGEVSESMRGGRKQRGFGCSQDSLKATALSLMKSAAVLGHTQGMPSRA